MYELRGMTCNRIIVLAAGRATRMRTSAASVEQTRFAQDALERPKPMIRVGPNGEPMLELILEQALRAGFTEATVVIAPNDTITPAFLQEWEGRGLGMRVQTAVQPEPLDDRQINAPVTMSSSPLHTRSVQNGRCVVFRCSGIGSGINLTGGRLLLLQLLQIL